MKPKLNYDYYVGQTFDLTQDVMNKMIDDVRTLMEEIKTLDKKYKAALEYSELDDFTIQESLGILPKEYK